MTHTETAEGGKTFPPVKQRGPHHGSPECERPGNRIQKREVPEDGAEDARTDMAKIKIDRDWSSDLT